MNIGTTPRQAFDDRDAALRALVSGTQDVIKQLQRLPDKDKQAVVAVLALAQFMGVYASSRARPDPTLVPEFYQSISALSPRIAARFDVRHIASACRDESIAYASAMASCLKDRNKTEDQCEVESASEAAGEVLCMLKQIESLKGVFGSIFRSKFPPGPQPRPVSRTGRR